jgi:hypothetical protein
MKRDVLYQGSRKFHLYLRVAFIAGFIGWGVGFALYCVIKFVEKDEYRPVKHMRAASSRSKYRKNRSHSQSEIFSLLSKNNTPIDFCQRVAAQKNSSQRLQSVAAFEHPTGS